MYSNIESFPLPSLVEPPVTSGSESVIVEQERPCPLQVYRRLQQPQQPPPTKPPSRMQINAILALTFLLRYKRVNALAQLILFQILFHMIILIPPFIALSYPFPLSLFPGTTRRSLYNIGRQL